MNLTPLVPQYELAMQNRQMSTLTSKFFIFLPLKWFLVIFSMNPDWNLMIYWGNFYIQVLFPLKIVFFHYFERNELKWPKHKNGGEPSIFVFFQNPFGFRFLFMIVNKTNLVEIMTRWFWFSLYSYSLLLNVKGLWALGPTHCLIVTVHGNSCSRLKWAAR